MQEIMKYFPKYSLKESGVINIDERPPFLQCILMGFQHVLTMFGATILAPLLMGFDTNTALFFSGLGTIIFYIVTGGRVPSFVGSSFAFIGVVVSATDYVYDASAKSNEKMDVAAGGIFVCGLVYGFIGLVVMFFGSKWIEILMPPVVTGTVVITIGISLSSSALSSATETYVDGWVAFTTVVTILFVSVYAPNIIKRFPVLIGLIVGCIVNYLILRFVEGTDVDYSKINQARWFGAPHFAKPKFKSQAISTIVPVCIVLLAENLGHLKAVGATVEKSLDKFIGRAIVGDAIATIVSASGCGPGTTTYAENIGVMAVTKNFSTLVFLLAGFIAMLLSFIQKIGAVIDTIPQGVFGGISIVLFGLVGVSGARIWVENRIDFKDSRLMLIAGFPIIIGAGMHTTLHWGNFELDGIGLSTYTAIILNQILRRWDSFNISWLKKKTPTPAPTPHVISSTHDP